MSPSQIPQLVQINVFTPKAGMMDEFIAIQRQGLPGGVPGLVGSQFYRAHDDRNVVAIACFEDEAAHRRFMETQAFQEHRQRLLPLLESTSAAYYTLVYARGGDGAASPLGA